MKVYAYPHAPMGWKPKLSVILDALGWCYGTAQDHDLRIYFSDRTIDKDGVVLDRQGRRHEPTTQLLDRTINAGCTDVSKSRVEAVFLQTFGYSSLVDDPLAQSYIEKGEIQAIKALRHVKPSVPRPDHLPQRFVDTRHDGKLFTDFRTSIIGGQVHLVLVKMKPKLTTSTGCRTFPAHPETIFTTEELTRLRLFADTFGLDFGELDVLRDKQSGKLYVVDVNPTANSDVDLPSIEHVLGVTTKQCVIHSYAQAFSGAFNRDSWLSRA